MRLSALSGSGQSLSRQEHDSITENKLVRRRTLAAQRSENQAQSPPWDGTTFPTIREVQSVAPNRDGNMLLEAIRKNSLDPPMYDPPQSTIQSPPLPPDGSPPRPQLKRYALSDAPPVRTTSPVRKLRKNQDHHNSPTNSPNITSARLVSGVGRAPSPGKTPRRKLTSDDISPVPIPPSSEIPILPPSVGDDVLNIPLPAGTSKRPTTFAEMGFQGVKAADKECIIM